MLAMIPSARLLIVMLIFQLDFTVQRSVIHVSLSDKSSNIINLIFIIILGSGQTGLVTLQPLTPVPTTVPTTTLPPTTTTIFSK